MKDRVTDDADGTDENRFLYFYLEKTFVLLTKIEQKTDKVKSVKISPISLISVSITYPSK